MSAAAVKNGDACPRCDKTNGCGMEKGEKTCWCFALPHVLPVGKTEEGSRCYCRACLSHVIADRTADALAAGVDGTNV